MMAVALRDFTGAGEDYVRNQLLDSSVFRNEDVLLKTRFIRPATAQEIKTARQVELDVPAPPVKKKIKLKVRRRT